MNLLIVLITYNRLDYTKRTIKALRDTIQLPHHLVVVDNASTDGTIKYLQSLHKRHLIDSLVLNAFNLYPGGATNKGWTVGLRAYPEATHLMRLDNDMHLERGWDLLAEEYFDHISTLGQLGLDHEAVEHPKAPLHTLFLNGYLLEQWPGCVGGPNIIRRKIWDSGIKYPETRWDDGRRSPVQEDSQFSKLIKDKGWHVGHTHEKVAWTFANPENWKDYPEYYKKTMTDRGYYDRLKEAGL